MLLFLIVGVASLLAITINIALSRYDFIAPTVAAIILPLIFAAMFIWGIDETNFHDTYTQHMQQTYDSYVYQLENDYYNKFTYDGRAELMDKILEYNKKVITGREKSHSPWFSWFYQEDFDSLELIDLSNY